MGRTELALITCRLFKMEKQNQLRVKSFVKLFPQTFIMNQQIIVFINIASANIFLKIFEEQKTKTGLNVTIIH